MTKSSVNFKALKSASHAVSHASRSVEPTYLLPEGKSLGTICLLDDRGNVASVIEAKMALASRQALRQGDYSPVWEGVINLQRPEVGCDVSQYKKDCISIISEWCKSYQKMTGHTVLRADIHLDEGHVVDGETLLNAHAHVMCDKTNEKGRVIKINAPELRKIQDMTAKVTGLDRGESSLKTGRKHIDHQAYKYLAERGRLETQQQVSEVKGELDKSQSDLMRQRKLSKEWSDADLAKVKDLKAEITQLKAQYDQDRATLKASGEATQKAYQALKAAHEGALAELKKSNQKAEKMEKQITQLTDENTQLKALWDAKTAYRDAELAKGTPDFLIDTTHVKAPPEAPKTAPEPTKATQAPIAPATDPKAQEGAFLALHPTLQAVEVGRIDGCKLLEAEGRLGVFSIGQGREVLCKMPSNKVMPKVGELFDSRAVPGQEGGVGR